MGLDMYLNASRFVWEPDDQLKDVAKELGLPLQGHIKIETEAAYWRKANQIHSWFVNAVQAGVDDCGSYYVSRGQLRQLIETCRIVLSAKNRDLAERLLPTQSGFFFGSADYDEVYYADLEDTISMIAPLLELHNEVEFYYSSSW